MAIGHCMLDNHGYKHTLRVGNTYWIPTTTIISLTRLDVTFYAYCPSCSDTVYRNKVIYEYIHVSTEDLMRNTKWATHY